MIAFALLTKYWQIAALVGALSFGAVMWHEHNVAEQELGAARERVHTLDSLRTVNAQQIGHVDTLYRRDTLRLTRSIARADTLRDSLLVHLTDTLRVKEFVAASDSALKVCRETMSDCNQFHALALQRFALDDAKLAAALKAQPRPHWYDGRIGIGPAFNIAPNGKSSVGVSMQLSVIRFP
jgi:hypothetical protein